MRKLQWGMVLMLVGASSAWAQDDCAFSAPRNLDLPAGAVKTLVVRAAAGGLEIDGYFPLNGEYEFKVQTVGVSAELHQLEITIDGERYKSPRDAPRVGQHTAALRTEFNL